eukprot:TRINITY_DN113_c0_g3_i1.p1 TRINITY_DN113_c0_g3~~TRINITY_DN113_c0_g3_i1.p1  ORF type:complete len:358 (+),score=42.36 TRINITY_DN113_c0_g3_i1:72-1076(+)
MDKSKEEKKLVFVKDQHIAYINNLENTLEKDEIGYYTNEHLRVSAGYWCLGSLALFAHPLEEKRKETLELLSKCFTPCGGFGGCVFHDPCLSSTHYAILQLALFDALGDKSVADTDKTAEYIAHLQKSDGSFMGDEWGEIDVRFSYYAISGLALLNKVSLIDTDKACEYILRCCNPDGAFGIVPGGESHAAYTFCAVAALGILRKLHLVDHDKLGQWLAKRQTTEGGFNGRPEKLPDVCYSWWVLSTLYIIKRQQWCNKKSLQEFILKCQNDEDGGIADRQGNQADVFHTFFGSAAMSLMGYPGLVEVDPLFVFPVGLTRKLFPHLSYQQNIYD